MLDIRKNKTVDTILQNMFSIGAVQFANNIITLLVMCFVSRAFGASGFGEVASQPYLSSEEFVNAIGVLKIMSVIPCLTIIASVTVQGLYALRLQRLASYLGLIVACVNCVANFEFVLHWGAR